jgi:hypothetical protein
MLMTVNLTEEDKAELKAALLTWRNDGVANPKIPLDYDVDGDGIADAYGLDANDELILIPGVLVADTVALTGTEGGIAETGGA